MAWITVGWGSLELADKLRYGFWTLGGLLLAWAIVARGLARRRRRLDQEQGWLDSLQLEEILPGSHPLIVDLRSTDLFRGPQGHIRGSLNVPFADLKARLGELNTKEPRPIVVVDERDDRLLEALGLIRQAGHPWSYALKGGLRAWRKANRPLVTF